MQYSTPTTAEATMTKQERDNFTLAEARDLYTRGCTQYLALFCAKHGYGYGDTAWVADEVGGLAVIGDYYVDMRTIITDLDMCAPEEEFLSWYDYCLEAHDLGIDSPNYSSWLSGCPRIPEERLQHLRELRAQLREETKRIKQEYQSTV